MTGHCTAFHDNTRIAQGTRSELVASLRGRENGLMVFEDATGRIVDLDWRGEPEAVEAAPPPRKRGRPKLGVVPREVTLLPRHWEWLNSQPGGASRALRRLVDDARKADGGRSTRRTAQERTYRFLSAIAGDFPHFEEATRHLFADDPDGFAITIAGWPADVQQYAKTLLEPPEGDES